MGHSCQTHSPNVALPANDERHAATLAPSSVEGTLTIVTSQDFNRAQAFPDLDLLPPAEEVALLRVFVALAT
jgi:hypothetical protein